MRRLPIHRVCLSALLSGLLIAASLCWAQTATTTTIMLDLPRQSQQAVVTQRIGITDITINYPRPVANGRQIWGKVVPYGEMWRAGANENTTITFTDPVTVEGQSLEKGTYALYMIPGEKRWIVIFSKTSWTGGLVYKQQDDALRVTVKSQTAEFHDALAYDFDEVKPDSTAVTMLWDKIVVSLKITVKANDIVVASLQRQMQGIDQYYFESRDDGAGYLLANKINLDEALKYEAQSIQLEERFENLIAKSRILDTMGRGDAATEFRNKALDRGNAEHLYGYGRAAPAQQQAGRGLRPLWLKRKKVSRPGGFASGPSEGLQRPGRFRKCRERNESCNRGAPDVNKLS
jgi:Protein of unknown function (DUF2911)